MALSKKQLQIIDVLDRNLAMCKDFMEKWVRFEQILRSYPSPGVNKAQLESQFLTIKSQLARVHQVLKDSLGSDYKFDSNMMNIVSGATSLEAIYAQSEVAIKKLENEWHRAFISINETLGIIEDKRRRAEMGEKVFIGMPQGEVKSSKPMSPAVIFLIVFGIVAVIAGVLMIIPDTREPILQQLGIR